MDSGRFNLFSGTADDGQAETVAIDWAFVGTGAIGQELKYLVFNSLVFRRADNDRARELYDACLEGYVAGLRDADWKGDPNSARYGCAAAAAMTFVRSWTLMADFWDDEASPPPETSRCDRQSPPSDSARACRSAAPAS